MIILFEEYNYKTEDLSKVLTERYYFPINSINSKINFVGYYFNSHINDGKGDVVIIFPKVFINKDNLAFNEFMPESLINPTTQIINNINTTAKTQIIFEISTWLYRAIQQFNKRHVNNSISENQYANQVITNLGENSNTELDIILSLLKFEKENKEFFTLITKTSHSLQNKINWHKTINKNQPIIQGNQPFYIDLATTRKKTNEDEELLILFYSTLNHIRLKYSFDFYIPQNFNLIKGHQFESILKKGCKLLKNIKYKYFSDKMICLYNLLYTYFERSDSTQSKKQIEEILLIRNFNIVFEDMVDDLIGENSLLPELKNHADGKQVDHLYQYKSLIIEDEIYFIGDSKYYSPHSKIDRYSKAKQFTYAKNIIQYNIDLFNSTKLNPKLRYRDDKTEGYNITPNFFISAFVNKSLNFDQHYLSVVNENPEYQCHFNNRLFDRDTLFVQSYNINFLFVLSSYISNNSQVKNNFKISARKIFREKILAYINREYKFCKITPKSSESVTKHFKLLIGKIYSSSSSENIFILATLKREDNTELLNKIKNDFEFIETDYALT